MTNPLRWPLHYQIIIAMVLGAGVGLALNPGARQLPDSKIAVAEQDGKLRLSGPGGYTEEFADRQALGRRFPELAKALEESKQNAIGLPVTERKVFLSEDGTQITLRYTRLQGDRRVVSSYEAATLDQLVMENPEWEPERAEAIDWYENLFARRVSVASKFVGDLFLRLLRMITVPLIVTSLVTGVASLGSSSRLGSMFGKTMLYYITTSLLAITTGIAMVNIVRPGIGVNLPFGGKEVELEQAQSLASIFVNLINSMIPPNPVQALAQGEFLSIITFSILVGFFIIKVGGESGATMRGFFQAAFDVMMAMTQAVIRLAPIGVFAFMLFATCTQGVDVFTTFAAYMLTVFLALLFHATVTLPLILWLVAGKSPWEFAKAMAPALLTAFSTASSNGTLPLTMTSVEKRAGVSNRVSSFVLPLGATVNMDGTALYEAVAVLFIAQAYTGGIGLDQQIVVAVTSLLASVGAAGIPSAGLVMMTIVLQAVDLPLEAVGLIIAVDRVLDMARTSVNVWSDSCGCAVLDRWEPTEDAPAVSEA